MTTALPMRPAATGLMPPGFDPRPCVNKPAQWWDLGDEHNARAIRYCRNVCPLRLQCRQEADGDIKPKGQIRAGHPYNEYGKRLTVCGECDTPRTRIGKVGAPVCGCTPEAIRKALTAAGRALDNPTDFERQRQQISYSTGDALVARWLPLHEQGLNIKQAADKLDISYETLKAALHRARSRGDQRVPRFRTTSKTPAVAA